MNNTNIIIILFIVYLFYYNITLDNQKTNLYNQQVHNYNQKINLYNQQLQDYNQRLNQYNKDIREYNRQIEQSNNNYYYTNDYAIDYTYTSNDIATLRAYGLRL